MGAKDRKPAKSDAIKLSFLSLSITFLLLLMSTAVVFLFHSGEQRIEVNFNGFVVNGIGSLAAVAGIFGLLTKTCQGFAKILARFFGIKLIAAFLLISANAWISHPQLHDQQSNLEIARLSDRDSLEFSAGHQLFYDRFDRKVGYFASAQLYETSLAVNTFDRDIRSLGHLSRLLASTNQQSDAEYVCGAMTVLGSSSMCDDLWNANPYDENRYRTFAHDGSTKPGQTNARHSDISSYIIRGTWDSSIIQNSHNRKSDLSHNIMAEPVIAYSMVDSADGQFTLNASTGQISLADGMPAEESEVRLRITIGGGRDSKYFAHNHHSTSHAATLSSPVSFVLERDGRVAYSADASVPARTTSYDVVLKVYQCALSGHGNWCGHVSETAVSSIFDLDDEFFSLLAGSSSSFMLAAVPDLSHRVMLLIEQGRKYDAITAVSRLLDEVQALELGDRLLIVNEFTGHMQSYRSRHHHRHNFPGQ